MKEFWKSRLGSRLLSLTLAAVMLFAMLPFGSLQASALESLSGTAQPLTTGGTVENNGTADVTVKYVDAITLDWVAADTSSEKNQDGWWIGIKVDAPEGLTEEDGATFRSKLPGKDWTDSVVFWENKDENGNAISLWTLLNQSILNDAVQADDLVQAQWQFDWDDDAVMDQTFTLQITASVVTLQKNEQTVYPPSGFGTICVLENPGFYFQSDIASSFSIIGNQTNLVTLTQTARIDVKKGWREVDAGLEAGWWIELSVTAPEGASSAMYQTLDNGVWSESTALTDGSIWLSIEWNPFIEAKANGEDPEFRWQFDWDGDGVFEQQVRLVLDSDNMDLHEEYYESFIFINPISSIKASETAYTEVQFCAEWNGSSVGITYGIASGGEYAEIDENTGKVTFKPLPNDVSSVDVKVQANPPADLVGAFPSIYYTFSIVKTASSVSFTNPADKVMTYDAENTQYANPASSTTGGTIVYTLKQYNGTEFVTPAAGDEVASVDEEGTVTIYKAGRVEITATRPADAFYTEDSASYELTVEKAERTISFENSNVTVPYGVKSYNENPLKTSLGSGEITYSIESQSFKTNATIDAATGKITLPNQETGTLTVRAVKVEDGCYTESVATYVLKVEQEDFDVSYKIEGVKSATNDQWYVQPMKISANKAGYQIGQSNSMDGVWKDSITISTDGAQPLTVYFRNVDTNAISQAVTISAAELQLDTTAPSNLGINYKRGIDDLFGFIIGKNELTVTLNASDATSGIASFTYTLLDEGTASEPVTVKAGDSGFSVSGNNASYTFKIDYDFNGKVSFYATDYAGHQTGFNGEEFILDFTAPVGEMSFSAPKKVFDAKENVWKADSTEWSSLYEDNANRDNFANYKLYYESDVTVTFKITEKNFDSDKVTISVNGTPTALTTDWTQDTENPAVRIGTLKLTEEGTYVITVSCEDAAGNLMDAYTSPTVIIDKTAPTLTMEPLPEGGPYYKDDCVVTLEIVEENFYPSGLIYEIKAKDRSDADIAITDPVKSCVWTHDGAKHTAVITFSEDAVYSVKFSFRDPLDRDTADATAEFTVGHSAPASESMSISYEKPLWETILEGITFGYYNPKVKVTLTAQDNISGIESITWSYTRQPGASDSNVAEVKDQVVSATQTGGKYSATFKEEANGVVKVELTLTASEAEQFRGNISFTAKNRVGLTSEVKRDSTVVVVDSVAPVGVITTVDYVRIVDGSAAENAKLPRAMQDVTNPEECSNPIYIYADQAKLRLTITEANFDPADVKITILPAEGGNSVAVDGVDAALTDWSQSGDAYTADLTILKEGDFTVTVTYDDHSGNKMEEYTSPLISVDRTAPVISVAFDPNSGYQGSKYFPNTDGRSATITVTEHNFRADEVAAAVTAKSDSTDYAGYLKNRANWERNGDVYTATILFNNDDCYNLKIDYTDLAGKSAQTYTADEFVLDRTAPDTAKMTVSYSTSIWETILEGITFGYYNPGVTVTLTAEDDLSGIETIEWTYTKTAGSSEVNEETFSRTVPVDQAPGKVAKVVFTLPEGEEAKQFNGTISFKATNHAGLTSAILNDGESNVVIVDSIAPVSVITPVDYVRIVDGSAAEDAKQPRAMQDVTNPEECSNPIYIYADQAKLRLTITEANFDPESVIIKIRPADESATILEGADELVVNGTDAALTKWNQDGDTYTADLTILKEGDFIVTVLYEDHSGNAMQTYVSPLISVDQTAPVISVVFDPESGYQGSKYFPNIEGRSATITITEHNFRADEVAAALTAKDSLNQDVQIADFVGHLKDRRSWERNGDTYTTTITFTEDACYNFKLDYTDLAGKAAATFTADEFILDRVAPVRAVRFPEAKQVTNADDNTTRTDYDYTAENTGSILYYDAAATVQLEITEENFDPAAVTLKINGVKQEELSWTREKDSKKYTASVVLAEAGEYVITMDYADGAGNAMQTYTSEKAIIDLVAPTIRVTYGNENVKNAVDGIRYFDEKQTATIEITEQNFRADDVVATVTAKNILGATVPTQDYAAYLKARTSWTHNGNVHTAVIEYTADANYTFDIAYKDLALRETEEYAKDSFTVDTAKPENLKISYSTAVRDSVLESISFGYYNAPVTVTISAEDETAGIYRFAYSYINAENVSKVNAELLNEAIENAKITHSGRTATATFTIPKDVLDSFHQFNGTVEFTAYDRSELSTRQQDAQRLVVDNITPTATISYSTPVQSANGISYYNGAINATIVINEANFYAQDVKLTVTKDGAAYAVTPRWTDNNPDVHTATFTLAADGDYIVSVSYSDRSNNTMTPYTSNRMTVDTQTPVIRVAGIKADSANKDKPYGFTITVTDQNFDVTTLQPVLTAVYRDKDGKYATKTVELPAAKTVKTGQEYTVTVEDLAEDAIYTLSCTARDMSGNAQKMVVLDDGESYESVRFSINRNGSTFCVDENTQKLIAQYYVYSVEHDVVIEEINVDPISIYTLKLNGNTLTEGVDYTTTQSGGAEQWSVRTYVLSKRLFDAEGEYSVIVESQDKAGTTAYSDVKGLTLSFAVDRTAPVLTISGLVDGGRYQVKEQTVTVIPTDDGGRLSCFKAVVLDSDGNPIRDEAGNDISVRLELSGEELEAYLEEHDGKLTFTVPEGYEQQVQVICRDYALHGDGTWNEIAEEYRKVTVSQSIWVIFYANKPLFYGVNAGVGALLLLFILLLIFKKKKKDEEEK